VRPREFSQLESGCSRWWEQGFDRATGIQGWARSTGNGATGGDQGAGGAVSVTHVRGLGKRGANHVSDPGLPHRVLHPASTRFFRSSPIENQGAIFSGIATVVPVFGFRPIFALLSRTVKFPHPRTSMRSPRARKSVKTSNMVSTKISTLCFGTVGTRYAIMSINSLLVMGTGPPRHVL